MQGEPQTTLLVAVAVAVVGVAVMISIADIFFISIIINY